MGILIGVPAAFYHYVADSDCRKSQTMWSLSASLAQIGWETSIAISAFLALPDVHLFFSYNMSPLCIGANWLRKKHRVGGTPRCTFQGHFSYMMVVTRELGWSSDISDPIKVIMQYWKAPHYIRQCALKLAMYLGLPPAVWTKAEETQWLGTGC